MPRRSRPLVLDRTDAMNTARSFVAERFTQRKLPTLRFSGNDFYAFYGSAYAVLPPRVLKSHVYKFLDGCRRIEGQKDVPFRPRIRDVAEVIAALEAGLLIEESPPAWLGQRTDRPDPTGLIVARNGWFDPRVLPLKVHPPTPELFTTAALDFEVTPEPTLPERWFQFLDSLELDAKEHDLLQEWFGYCLTADTSQQKALVLLGPRRGGKGVIGRLLAQLVGPANVAGPTLSSLAERFGLSCLVHARLGIIGDARLSGRANHGMLMERLLSITGEDILEVDVKNREPVTRKLDARLMILTNEPPKLSDGSGALSGRLMILRLRHSFFGRENNQLEKDLKDELPGILLWSVEGLRRLAERGRFTEPKSTADEQVEMARQGSPLRPFVDDCCELGPEKSVPTTELFEAWLRYAEKKRVRNPGDEQSFGRNLRIVVPEVKTPQRRGGGDVFRVYTGIDLLPEYRPEPPQ